MNRPFALSLLGCILVGWMTACAPPTAEPFPTVFPSPVPSTATPVPVDPVSRLHWFDTAAFLYNGSQTIYFDPYELDGTLPTADLILISHDDGDHWSMRDLKQIIGSNTRLVISTNVADEYEDVKDELGIPAIILSEGKTTEVNGVGIRAVPAFAATSHLRSDGGLGYIVTVDGTRIYHADGTTSYPEMVENECDIAILPLFSPDDARKMMELVPAGTYIFEHTGLNTIKAFAEQAAEDGLGRNIVILEPGPYVP